MVPLWLRVDQGVMGIKGYSTFPKSPGLKLTIRLFSFISWTLVGFFTSQQRCSRRFHYQVNEIRTLVYFCRFSWRKILDEWNSDCYELLLTHVICLYFALGISFYIRCSLTVHMIYRIFFRLSLVHLCLCVWDFFCLHLLFLIRTSLHSYITS